MSMIRNVCVYCGSSPGHNPAFIAAAKALGTSFAEHDIGLVYGGGSLGMMGAIASAVADRGGRVIGIIPEFLQSRERTFKRAHEVVVTADMHERKQLMFERADAFVALPGGVGTLEELIEQLTWAQLGRHKKPILIANINGFWDPLLQLLDHMRKLGYIHAGGPVHYLTANRVEDIIPQLIDASKAVASRDLHAGVEQVEGM